MDFRKMMRPVERRSVFTLAGEDFYVWCPSLICGEDGKYYLYFSFWAREKGFNGWISAASIGLAVADDPLGPFTFRGVVLAPAGGTAWDRDCVHAPNVQKFGDRYYIYYMGNYGNGDFWDHRNHQRLGVAWSRTPYGPFHRSDAPLLDATPGTFDALLLTDPSVTVGADGKYRLMYKAVGRERELPRGGPIVFGIATAESPLGPFTKHPEPVGMNPPGGSWVVEDPYLWYDGKAYRALVKDFRGDFSGMKYTVGLLRSPDGIAWEPDETPCAFTREITWADGERELLFRMEQPQLLLDGARRPAVLLCPCCRGEGMTPEDTFLIATSLQKE